MRKEACCDMGMWDYLFDNVRLLIVLLREVGGLHRPVLRAVGQKFEVMFYNQANLVIDLANLTVDNYCAFWKLVIAVSHVRATRDEIDVSSRRRVSTLLNACEDIVCYCFAVLCLTPLRSYFSVLAIRQFWMVTVIVCAIVWITGIFHMMDLGVNSSPQSYETFHYVSKRTKETA